MEDEMAKAADRSSGNTDLYIGTLKAEIGLFGTQAKPGKEQEFDTAGPNGGALRYEKRGVESPPDVPVEAPASPVEPADALTGNTGGFDPEGFVRSVTTTAGSVAGEFRQVLVEEGSNEVVAPEQVRRGVRLGDGRFVDVTDQLAAIVERTKLDRIDVVSFVDSTRVTRERVIGAYYVGAQSADAKAVLRLLYEALRERREAAVVKYTTRSRQNLGVIVPHAKTKTLMLLSLVFAEDYREAPKRALAIQDAKVTPAHVQAMCKLLAAMHTSDAIFDELRDDAIALREELRARAVAGEMDAEVVEALPEPEAELDLGDALGQSLAAVRGGKA